MVLWKRRVRQDGAPRVPNKVARRVVAVAEHTCIVHLHASGVGASGDTSRGAPSSRREHFSWICS